MPDPWRSTPDRAVQRLVAIVKPFKLDSVLGVLRGLGVEELVVEEVLGYARQKGHRELYSGSEYDISLIPKVRIEACVDGALAEQAALRVAEAARTGRVGDGKIFLGPAERVQPPRKNFR